MMKKAWKTIVMIMPAALTLASCATTIALRVPRTPTLDTSGIRRVAVMPFESPRRNRDARKAADHATAVATDRIRATGNFTLVSHTMIEPRRRAGQSFDDLVDALFVGRITQINEQTNEHQGQRKNRETGETVTYTYYSREVEIEFNYSFIHARDGTIIGPVTRRGTASETKEDWDALASVEALAKTVINNQMSSLHRDIAPYVITVNRTLVKESNKALKPEMESALAHVKSGNYRAARDAYVGIYETHKSVAAAENASILYEALGETKAGADFMQRVVSETGSPKARDALARLNRELRESASVVEFREKSSKSPAERAAETAFNEVQGYLPDDARVWIVNGSADENALINSVIDNMTAALLRDGITIVDRRAADLIQAEQAFQMSGHVSDGEIVSIGNTAGANKIIVVSVSPGSGGVAARRLQVRVLDVERGVIIMQSDGGERWGL